MPDDRQKRFDEIDVRDHATLAGVRHPKDDDRIAGAIAADEITRVQEIVQARIDKAAAEAIDAIQGESKWRKRYQIAKRLLAFVASQVVPLIETLLGAEATKEEKHAAAREQILFWLKVIESRVDIIPWGIEALAWKFLERGIDAGIHYAYDVFKGGGKPAVTAA